MKYDQTDPPRVFSVEGYDVVLKECAKIQLDPDELVTFISDSGTEYDVTRKSWGYYATPSLNHRLPRYRLRPVLAQSDAGTFFINLVETGREEEYATYLAGVGMTAILWLDDIEVLEGLARSARAQRP